MLYAQRASILKESQLSLQVLPANVQVLQGRVWALLMNAIAGRNVCGSFAILDQSGLWLKMSGVCCQSTLDGCLEEYSGTWPKWGMMLNGECMAPTTSALHNSETGCILWPSAEVNGKYNRKGVAKNSGEDPVTVINNWPTITVNGNNNRKGISNKSGDGLSTAVKNWATPNTMDALPPKSKEAIQREAEGPRKGRSAPANLRDQINGYWPTPKASDAVIGITAKTSDRPIEKSTHLGTQVYLADHKLWPTPKASDATRGTCPSEEKRRTPGLMQAVKNWPTPKSRDYRSGRPDNKRASPDLNDMVLTEKLQNWATPNASDSQGSTGGGQGRSLRTDVHGSGGQLNPDWVETLMGYPVGWTDIEKIQSFDLFRKREFWEVFNQQWPARRGEQQREWEPSRVVHGMKDRVARKERVARIKILGNAVVPQWAFIVLSVIVALEKSIHLIKTPLLRRSVM